MYFLSKKTIIILLLILCVIFSAAAQNTKSSEQMNKNKYRVGAALGYSFAGYREETYSPINRYLNTLTYTIYGNIEKENFLHSLNISFFMGNAEIKGGESPVLLQMYDPQKGEPYIIAKSSDFLNVRAYLEYALDYQLWGNETFPGFLGGAFRADAYLQFAYYPSITGLVSLDLHASQKWIIDNENQLILSVGFPLLGYAVRPSYAGADHALIKYSAEDPLKIITLGNVTSLHNYWAVFSDLKYHHKINGLLSLSSGLYFELSRINIPRPRFDAILRLQTGISFTL
jgi:hypothetical protein